MTAGYRWGRLLSSLNLGVVCEHVMLLMVCELDELTLIGSMQLPLDWPALIAIWYECINESAGSCCPLKAMECDTRWK